MSNPDEQLGYLLKAARHTQKLNRKNYDDDERNELLDAGESMAEAALAIHDSITKDGVHPQAWLPPEDNWKLVGHVAVDAGCVLLADPSNVEDFDYEAEVISDWVHHKPVLNDLGTLVSSGLGDGFYPVEVRIEDAGDWGERVAEVRIRFLPHPVLG